MAEPKDIEREKSEKQAEQVRSGEWEKMIFDSVANKEGEKKKPRKGVDKNCNHKRVDYNFTLDTVECLDCLRVWASVDSYKKEKEQKK